MIITNKAWGNLTKKLQKLNCDYININNDCCVFSAYGVCVKFFRDGKFESSRNTGTYNLTPKSFYIMILDLVDFLKYQDQLH